MLDCLQELGTIYWMQSRYPEAETCLKRALKIIKSTGSEETDRAARIMNRLGTICSAQGMDDEAIALHQQAIAIRTKIFGPACPTLAESMSNLGEIYMHKGRLKEAEELLMQALKVRENSKSYGPEHPYLWYALVDLGDLYAFLGEYDKAEAFNKKSLKVVEKAYGLSHPHACTSLNQLAKLYAAWNKYDKSLADYNSLMESRHKFIEDVFSYASEAQKMRYVKENPVIDYSFLSLAIIDTSTQTRRCALEMVLKGKAIILDALSVEKELTYCVNNERIVQTEKQHKELQRQIANLCLSNINGSDPKKYGDSLQILNAIRDSLETELSHLCLEFKDELATRKFSLEDVANALPSGIVLWEFVRYEPFDFRNIGNEEVKSLPARYLAFTLNHENKVTLTDLGEARMIDSLISLTRQQIYQARTDVYSPLAIDSERHLSKVTGKLYKIVFAPLETELAGKSNILISPDGQLNLLPFGILLSPDGKYLVEKYGISYLSSGRDLLKFKKETHTGVGAMILADPDFGYYGKTPVNIQAKELIAVRPPTLQYEPARGADGCLEVPFNRLRHSRDEAELMESILKSVAHLKVDLYCDSKAQEEVLKERLQSPRILHIATHGYFCGDMDWKANQTLENPLLRSGLALAGANRLMDEKKDKTDKREDGILTAMEASGLNLNGTELVTLSACETGVGEVRNGEGVYSLGRAFQHAGARTIMMSLWRVPDKETGELMSGFYQNWLSGQTKQEALRQSTLNLLNACRSKYGVAHPLLWGGFVMVGDPN
jgi:CHAT domain-containing protein/tetratricopeptide (TPR) repeat protein